MTTLFATKPAGPPAMPGAYIPAGPMAGLPSHAEAKWSWSCRAASAGRPHPLLKPEPESLPRVGDVALFQVESLGHHMRLATADGSKVRLYADDTMAGVFGNRYATDAFEAEVQGLDNLHMLTDAGMVGTVRSRHRDVKPPTRLRCLGYLADGLGQRLNLRVKLPPVESALSSLKNVLVVVGTGMNSGKTTTATKLVKALLRRGLRVAACKLTGSVCPRDRGEFSATGVHHVSDFSDFGFPSTYLASEEELVGLYRAMVADADATEPDIVVMEIADGILQRETQMLLGHHALRGRVGGVVLAATCAASALYGVDRLQAQGHTVVAVSGCITNAPLFLREFAAASPVPLASSTADCVELAEMVGRHYRVLP